MRYCGLDILRGFAAFFIVGCHIILPSRTDSAGMLMHFCNMFVGVFGVISGFLLGESIAKGRSMKQQIVRRCARLLPIYFAWSILYVLVSLGFGLIEHNGDKIARLWDYGYWAGVIFYGGASCHLWYVSSLFYGTLVIIIISKVVQRGASFLLLGGCAIAISTYLGKCHFALYELRLLGFMLTGYWLRIETKDCKNTGEYRVLLVWLVFAILLHVMLRDVIHGFVRDWFVAIPLVKLFLGYDISVKLPKLKKAFAFMGKNSLGVYLVHPFFAACVGLVARKVFSQPYDIAAWASSWVVIYLLSLFATCVMRKFSMVERHMT